MDPQQYQNPFDSMPQPQKPKTDCHPLFALSSMIFGTLSILLIFMGIGMIPGALAIILGVMSKGRQKYDRTAVAGMITGAISVVASLIFTIIALQAIASGKYDDTIKEMEEMYQSYFDEANSPMSSSIEPDAYTHYLEMDGETCTLTA